MSHLYKSWQNPDSGQKKFLSSTLMYHLSKNINKDLFEAVNESYIDVTDINSEQPDLVIYDKQNKFRPALIIECVSDVDEADAIRTIEILCSIYHIKEGFIYNFEREHWKKVGSDSTLIASNAHSDVLGINIDRTLADGLLRYD